MKRATVPKGPPPTRSEIETRRIMRHLRAIVDDPQHPSHLEVMAHADLSILVELHNGRDQ